MPKPWGRKARRFACPRDVDSHTCRRLLNGVWSLEWQEHHQRVPPVPYIDHWSNLVQEADESDLHLYKNEIAVKLVEVLKQGLSDDLSSLRDRIQSQYPNAIAQSSITTDQALKGLQFAIRLWLYVYPDLTHQVLPSTTLKTLIVQSIPPKTSDKEVIQGRLSDDFCAKHLWRRGGISIRWTDDLNEHLTLVHQHRSIRVFRHSNMLRVLVQDASVHDPFPPGFASETLDTLCLLFRPLNPRKARRNVRRMEKFLDTDLELAITQTASFDLNNFRYWHDRLQAIQRVYDRKRPASLTQWWFDRRDRVQWATFWVAFVVFVLTVVFGVIQSVTGVLQAWAAYHPISN